MTPEPNFSREKELENAIALAATEFLRAKKFDVVTLQGFGLDVAVFAKRGGMNRTKFFEIKSFAAHHGRCGLGDSSGRGNQIRILFDDALQTPRAADVLELFNPSIRWVLGNRSAPIGSKRYALFTSQQAQVAAANGVRSEKQNNFRLSAFKDSWVAWADLLGQMDQFLDL
jgi:hypothetical protein